jgi:hypothetical protein
VRSLLFPILVAAAQLCALSETQAGASPWQTKVVKAADGTQEINVPEGKVIEFLDISFNGVPEFGLYFRDQVGYMGFASSVVTPPKKWVGPMKVAIKSATGSSSYVVVAYRLIDNVAEENTPIPSATVVIPTNAGGNVQVILESSTDLVNWTAALPGSYSSSTSNRFFRVRTQQQN